jgi:signal transduction histidine kinase
LAAPVAGLLLFTAILQRKGWFAVLPLLPLLALGWSQWNLGRLTQSWGGPSGERERRIQRASARLNDELTGARLLADSLASRGLALATIPREREFEAAAALAEESDLESGLMVLEGSGTPRVWAGRFRVGPEATGDSVGVRLTPYYVVLEVRRHDASGRTAIGSVLLSADSVIPDGNRSVAARFREHTEVGLRLLAPETAPDISDVFDYELPTTAGPRVLFSVQFVPPGQAEAIARTRRTGSIRVTLLFLLTIVGALVLVPAGLGRLVVFLLPVVLVFRSPPSPGNPEWFLALAVTGIALILLSQPLRKRQPATWLAGLLAGILMVATPLLLGGLGSGILPPSAGGSTRLFLVWDLALFLFGAGLLMVALALVPSRTVPKNRGAPVALTLLLSLSTMAVGFLIWQPGTPWPSWYFVLWLIGLLPFLLPRSRVTEIASVAVWSGSFAAVLAWGAGNQGKVRAAEQDMVGLSRPVGPAETVELDRLGRALLHVPVPQSRSDLYRIWRTSPLYHSRVPVVLGLWQSDGVPRHSLALGELDLPEELVAGAVRSLSFQDSVSVRVEQREPAPHRLLLVRMDSARVLVIGIGPPTELIAPSRLARLLGAEGTGSPWYRLALSSAPRLLPNQLSPMWEREGSSALGHARLSIPGTSRGILGTVDIGSPDSLAVRGALLLILNGVVLGTCWVIGALLTGEGLRRPAWLPAARSYETRIGIALAVFFLAPTVGFFAWGIGRLRGEVRASRDRGIEQTLRDVLPERAVLLADSLTAGDFRQVTRRSDADFGLYRGGRLIAGTSGGLLETLGILPPVMDPRAYYGLAVDGGEVVIGPSPSMAVDVRIGYRALGVAGLEAGALAMPQTGFDPILEDRQRDLAMLFLLFTMLGVAASLLAAHFAARALSRPVAELQSAALAFGKGKDVVLPSEPPSLEFAPVYQAFEKMTSDVRKTQEAQDRVARIVAWGEMASQVAHEIKNPLTPMRLGVQHLRRVHEDGHTPIGPVLESTTTRILAEIDRLDRIARSFSRFGVPSSERGPLETVKLPSVVRDVVELYRLGPEGAEIVVDVDQPELVAARADEVKEALVNLLENSRNARARTIRVRIRGSTIAVEDDGKGIPADLLPRIFEPRFSTSTSGSGLGLAIVKRLVEGWGGTVGVESTEGSGTTVRLDLRPARPAGPGPATR